MGLEEPAKDGGSGLESVKALSDRSLLANESTRRMTRHGIAGRGVARHHMNRHGATKQSRAQHSTHMNTTSHPHRRRGTRANSCTHAYARAWHPSGEVCCGRSGRLRFPLGREGCSAPVPAHALQAFGRQTRAYVRRRREYFQLGQK